MADVEQLNLQAIMNARILHLCIVGALILPRLAGAEDRICRITFKLQEAKFNDQGKMIGEVPRADVTIRLRPDQFTTGEASRTGQTDKDGNIQHLIVAIPANIQTAYGHLELTDENQPWKTEEELYFLWRYGYSHKRHDEHFEIEHHQPRTVLLIPIGHAREYFEGAVLTRSAPNNSATDYFRDLITDILEPSSIPKVQLLGQSFTDTKETVVKQAADYWNVRPEKIIAGLSSWVADANTAPAGKREYDKVLATAFNEDLLGAWHRSVELASRTGDPDQKAKFIFTGANLSVAFARDLIKQSEREVIAESKSSDEMLKKARGFLVQALQQYSEIPKIKPDVTNKQIAIQQQQAVASVLEKWTVASERAPTFVVAPF